MLVYRIEDDNNRGAYRARSAFDGDLDRHPTPLADSGIYDVWTKLLMANSYENYFFGFASIEQMRAWFYKDQWLVNLESRGMKLSIYEVSEEQSGKFKDFYVGNAQVIFRLDRARLVEKKCLTEYVTTEVSPD